jgi:hypothetical protein
MFTRGIASMFDDSTEFIFALVYAVALLFSIFMHIKLRNNTSIANKICAIVTLINVISLIGLALSVFNSSSDDGLFLVAWMFGVVALWLMSLIFGIIGMKNRVNSVVA